MFAETEPIPFLQKFEPHAAACRLMAQHPCERSRLLESLFGANQACWLDLARITESLVVSSAMVYGAIGLGRLLCKALVLPKLSVTSLH